MPRAPFQILVFPYRFTTKGTIEYAIFERSDLRVWQAISGGGEDAETPEEAAAREVFEESGIRVNALTRLSSTGAVAVESFASRVHWDPVLRTIPEYSFGFDIGAETVALSDEHLRFEWLNLAAAVERLEWESNCIAIRELNSLLTSG